ncbi:MAG: chemotaxis protein CheW [Pseudolabrys sp.]
MPMAGGVVQKNGETALETPITTNGEGKSASPHWLLCRVAAHHFALPVADVIETMRMLPVESIAGAPAIVRGLCVIRGVPTPVVDAAMLFDDEPAHGDRLVTARTQTRTVAFVADAVVGVRAIEATELDKLPPLLRDVQTIAVMKTLDEELVFFLQTARVLPEEALHPCFVEGVGP